MIDLDKFKVESTNASGAISKVFSKLKKKPPANIDEKVHQLHEEAFEEFDCLTCANCCKTTSPIFYQKDIERASKFLRVKPGKFIESYLHIDEDNDYVLNSVPCTFLGQDNYCSIYEARPTACREYPHTNRKRVSQLFDLAVKNALICPAVFYIYKKLADL